MFLDLTDNPISSQLIPPEVLHTRRAQHILAAYRRYRYARVLPRGLIPRFIVSAHQLLSDRPTRWRTGALLVATTGGRW